MLPNPYETNGLVFWTEPEIKLRRAVEETVVAALTHNLKTQNRGFEVIQVEAPVLTPRAFVNSEYSDESRYVTHDDLMLRPETTMGSYAAAKALLNPHNDRKVKVPLVVWQHGKSFRREQDQPTKFMRLKEFYQLEFQILYSHTTAKDYSVDLIPEVRRVLSLFAGPCRVEPSDRVPSYAEWTQDIVCEENDMEICSMSLRNDFDLRNPLCHVLEVAIGTDRVVYNALRRE